MLPLSLLLFDIFEGALLVAVVLEEQRLSVKLHPADSCGSQCQIDDVYGQELRGFEKALTEKPRALGHWEQMDNVLRSKKISIHLSITISCFVTLHRLSKTRY